MTDYVIGIDGGATKTHALALDLRGRCIGFGVAGCGSHESTGIESASSEVLNAIERACGADAGPASHACLGLAGVHF